MKKWVEKIQTVGYNVASKVFALNAKTYMNISVRVTLNQTIVSIKQFGVFVAHPLDSDSVHYFLFIHNWTKLVLEKHWFLKNTKWFWSKADSDTEGALGKFCINWDYLYSL